MYFVRLLETKCTETYKQIILVNRKHAVITGFIDYGEKNTSFSQRRKLFSLSYFEKEMYIH